jgi:hypothetical protein
MNAAGQNMNCEDYKEAVAADPSESFDGGSAHASACVSCSSYRDEMREMDDMIARALSIAVPELQMPELPPIDEDSNVVNLPFGRKARFTTPAWIGIAASFAIVAVFGARFLGEGSVRLSLADEVIAHLDHERQSLRVTSTPVSERSLSKVVSSNVAVLDGVGLITYARTCPINGKAVPHLVVQGENGPITLLLMPEEMIDSAIPLLGEGIEGIILPVGEGSIAIIGERGERLEEIEQRVIDSVRWDI